MVQFGRIRKKAAVTAEFGCQKNARCVLNLGRNDSIVGDDKRDVEICAMVRHEFDDIVGDAIR
jgi:hypothetical protein